jgi:citronellol/citronellal dehydrogenase
VRAQAVPVQMPIMGSLTNKTLFITGASRGIGKAIALRAARDGANVVVVAKTVDPHYKLPGTIHDAASEIQAAGGRALAVQADIRSEEQVQNAVDAAVDRFGGIDILVNNASAISLTGTLATPVRKFDLMMGVNARGTFVCSRTCLPHLLRSSNPHILTLAPPPDIHAKWFAPHGAYTLAKMGMSLLSLGMAEEFRERGVAVNCLWPRTLIATAALSAIDVGSAAQARKPEIMADAACEILRSDSRAHTGKFYVDEDVLRDAGVESFDQYAMTPGVTLKTDIFLPD